MGKENGQMDELMTVSVEPDRNKNRALADISLTAEHPDYSRTSVGSADRQHFSVSDEVNILAEEKFDINFKLV